MDLIEKLQELIQIQNLNNDIKVGGFDIPIVDDQIKQLEKLLAEPLPKEFITLYRFANGQVNDTRGILFDERFLNSEEIIRQLEISLSFVKPTEKKIINEAKSNSLLQTIVDFYVAKSVKRNLIGFKKKWHKIEFKCSIDSFEGPYLYPNSSTSDSEREMVSINSKDHDTISKTVLEIYELEKEHYNWDKLEFVVFSNGGFKVERTFYDFDNLIKFTSNPENAIKKKYFHYKWLPIFSDYGGNYIGIDLDPDTNGKKGQIINFGRDEEDMVVLADSLDEFFDFLLSELKKPDNKLINSNVHFHDVLKEMKV